MRTRSEPYRQPMSTHPEAEEGAASTFAPEALAHDEIDAARSRKPIVSISGRDIDDDFNRAA